MRIVERLQVTQDTTNDILDSNKEFSVVLAIHHSPILRTFTVQTNLQFI